VTLTTTRLTVRSTVLQMTQMLVDITPVIQSPATSPVVQVLHQQKKLHIWCTFAISTGIIACRANDLFRLLKSRFVGGRLSRGMYEALVKLKRRCISSSVSTTCQLS